MKYENPNSHTSSLWIIFKIIPALQFALQPLLNNLTLEIPDFKSSWCSYLNFHSLAQFHYKDDPKVYFYMLNTKNITSSWIIISLFLGANFEIKMYGLFSLYFIRCVSEEKSSLSLRYNQLYNLEGKNKQTTRSTYIYLHYALHCVCFMCIYCQLTAVFLFMLASVKI